MKPKLTIPDLISEAEMFCKKPEIFLLQKSDGKSIGTDVEKAFKDHVAEKYSVIIGDVEKGIDFPESDILTDVKVTSMRQPQSSCPFKDAKQKIFGLGYNLLVFAYDKNDHQERQAATLEFVSCSFVEKERTGDFTTTFRLREMIKDGANVDDIFAYLNDKNIPADPITLQQLAEQILQNPPTQGYLTISNALQWRLQYQRVVNLNEPIDGITKIIDKLNR